MEEINFSSDIKHNLGELYPNNKDFKVLVWKKKDKREITIFINGFLEGVEFTDDRFDRIKEHYFAKYKDLGKRLLEKEINSVFLPLPFHHNRGKDIGRAAPLKRLMEHGSNLYYGGYDQILSDLEKLIAQIKKNRNDFGLLDTDKLKDEDIQFHLLGYSIGGVAAMGAAKKLEQKFASMTILLSSWNIAEIEPTEIERSFKRLFNFTSSNWNILLDQLKKSNIEDLIFNQLIWGDKDFTLPKENKVKRILFIHGIDDKLFNTKMTAKRTSHLISSEAQNCSFHILPSKHDAQNPFIMSLASEFISFNKSK